MTNTYKSILTVNFLDGSEVEEIGTAHDLKGANKIIDNHITIERGFDVEDIETFKHSDYSIIKEVK